MNIYEDVSVISIDAAFQHNVASLFEFLQEKNMSYEEALGVFYSISVKDRNTANENIVLVYD